MDATLRQMLGATISYAAPSSVSATGQTTWATASTAPAFVEPSTRILEQADGTKVATSHMIVTEAAITTAMRVWMPGDSAADATKARRPLRVDPIYGEDSVTLDHYEMWL